MPIDLQEASMKTLRARKQVITGSVVVPQQKALTIIQESTIDNTISKYVKGGIMV